MDVQIVSVTQGLGIEGVTEPLSPEELIVYCARVSNPSNQANMETAPRLLRYLIRNRHWSPFELVDVTLLIETSRDIAAQILRHRSFSFQEFSLRYAKALGGFEYWECRYQHPKSRQLSVEGVKPGDAEWWKEAQEHVWRLSLAYYDQALSRGVAREVARHVLPLGVQTRLYMKGSLRSWIHYCAPKVGVRADITSQKEHRLIAEAAWTLIRKWFPSTAAAIEEGL